MEGNLQTSFIPKKSPSQVGVASKTGVNLVTLFAVIIFLVSIALAGTVFIYESYLSNNIKAMQNSFKLNEQAFNPESITAYSTLNARINVANTLLKNHVAVSNIFDLLEQATLKTVRFTDFNYSYINNTRLTIAMKGQATSYNAIAKQSDVFNADPMNKYIHNAIFANLDLDQSGNVVFSLNADVDPQQVLYRNNLPSQQDVTTNVAPQATVTSLPAASGTTTTTQQ